MELLVAHGGDPAGLRMARHASQSPHCGRLFEVKVTDTPVISADWLDEPFDSYVFLSRHAAASGKLALTCHSTGNFGPAQAGGRDSEVAPPHPDFQRQYMRNLHARRDQFPGFDITIEATHHGPTALSRPSVFVEVGTGPDQWTDDALCGRVAQVVIDTLAGGVPRAEYGFCLGGGHYPAAFTRELLEGERALGTVVPRRALPSLDDDLLDHLIRKNTGASCAMLDWSGMGSEKARVLEMLRERGVETVRL